MKAPTPESPFVDTDWWAETLGISIYTVRGIAARVAAGGDDPRIPPPLDVPGPYRWRRSDALAHIAAIPVRGGRP